MLGIPDGMVVIETRFVNHLFQSVLEECMRSKCPYVPIYLTANGKCSSLGREVFQIGNLVRVFSYGNRAGMCRALNGHPV